MRASVSAAAPAAGTVEAPAPPRPLVCKDAAMGKGSKAKAEEEQQKHARASDAEGRGARPARRRREGHARPQALGQGRQEGRRRSGHKAAKARKDKAVEPVTWTDALRVGPGFRLADLDPHSTPGFTGDKADGQGGHGLSCRRGSATCRSGSSPSPRAAAGARCCSSSRAWTPPARAASCATSSARSTRRACTSPRSRRRAPRRSGTRSSGASATRCRQPGQIGVFDRSHYEDVLIVRVHDLVPRTTWSRRYAQINAFEQGVVDSGTVVVKVMLHISGAEQKARLGERLEREDKHWKFNPGDIDERGALGRLHAGLPGGAGEVLDGGRAVVRRARRPQVVRPARRHQPAARAPRGDGPEVARRRLRRRGARRSGWRSLPERALQQQRHGIRPDRGAEGAEGAAVVAAEPARDERVGDRPGGVPHEQRRLQGQRRGARRAGGRPTGRPGRAPAPRPTRSRRWRRRAPGRGRGPARAPCPGPPGRPARGSARARRRAR